MTQPEALRLADALEDDLADYGGQSLPRISQDIADNAAAELRRLHAANEQLATEVANRNRRALDGDEAVFALANVHAYYEKLEAQRDALLEALLRIESAVDWYLGRSSFTQTTQLKGLKHSANVRKELFAAHDEVRAAIKAVEEGK